jgi:hypothetical protein
LHFFCNFRKNAKSKQPPKWRKFAQSGHPVAVRHHLGRLNKLGRVTEILPLKPLNQKQLFVDRTGQIDPKMSATIFS